MFVTSPMFTGDTLTHEVGATPVFIDFDQETFSTEASNEDCSVSREVIITGLMNPAARSYLETAISLTD